MASSRLRMRQSQIRKAKKLGIRGPDLVAALEHWMPIMLWLSRADASGDEIVPVLIEHASAMTPRVMKAIPANTASEAVSDTLFTVLGVPHAVLVTALLGIGQPELARQVSAPPPRDHKWTVVVAASSVKAEAMPLISPHLAAYDDMMRKLHESLLESVRDFRSQGLLGAGQGLIALDYHDHFGRFVASKLGMALPPSRAQGTQWPRAIAPVPLESDACPTGSVLVLLITGGYEILYVLSDAGIERVVKEPTEVPLS